MRHDGPPSPGADHGGLPETWSRSLRYELSGALACSTQSAESIASLAWQLGARLPRIGARLDDGTLTSPKAKAIAETLELLTDPDAAAAEALIADQLAGKTYTQVLRLAEQAALTVDPGVAERRREHAQKNYARVSFFREQAGTAGLSGRDLPPDEALAAMAAVNARAEEYKESDAFDDTPMDVLRAHAYLDLINGVSAAERIAIAEQQDDDADAAQAWASRRRESRTRSRARPDDAHPDPDDPAGPATARAPSATAAASPMTTTTRRRPRRRRPSRSTTSPTTTPSRRRPRRRPRRQRPAKPMTTSPTMTPVPTTAALAAVRRFAAAPAAPAARGPRPGAPPTGRSPERRPADLIVPLATLLGLAERPGEIHGFGLLDPALARQLAAAAAASPRTEVCVTVTSGEGYAIGHGCARPARTSRQAGPAGIPARAPRPAEPDDPRRRAPRPPRPPRGSRRPVVLHPAHPAHPAPRGRPGATDDFGTWTLALPGGRELTVRLDPVPTLRMRPPVRDPPLPAQRPAPAPRPDQRRHLHVPALQPARPRVRLRARPAL